MIRVCFYTDPAFLKNCFMIYEELYTYEFINGSLQRFVGHWLWLDERIANYYRRKVTRKLKCYQQHIKDVDFIMKFKLNK